MKLITHLHLSSKVKKDWNYTLYAYMAWTRKTLLSPFLTQRLVQSCILAMPYHNKTVRPQKYQPLSVVQLYTANPVAAMSIHS